MLSPFSCLQLSVAAIAVVVMWGTALATPAAAEASACGRREVVRQAAGDVCRAKPRRRPAPRRHLFEIRARRVAPQHLCVGVVLKRDHDDMRGA